MLSNPKVSVGMSRFQKCSSQGPRERGAIEMCANKPLRTAGDTEEQRKSLEQQRPGLGAEEGPPRPRVMHRELLAAPSSAGEKNLTDPHSSPVSGIRNYP